MKRFAIMASLFFCIPLVNASWGVAGEVRGTKHDLSMPVASGGTGPGPIQSTSAGTTEICVFCHTPHGARTGAPLWNRSMSTETYTVYTSDVLQALGMTADNPSDTGASDYAIHTKTRICLSCHDGTIALGTLANFPDGISNIPMSNSNAGKIPSTSAGYIGTDLSDDHPVAIKHNAGSGANQDPELKNPIEGNARLYNVFDGKVTVLNQNGNYVECTSCHNAHDNQYGNFLVESNKQSAVCKNCHNKTGFTGSAHDDDSIMVTYQPSDGVGGNLAGPLGRVGEVKCMNCHFPHKAGLNQGSAIPNAAYGRYLLSFKEENSCFVNPSDRWATPGATSACHGTGGAKNIESDIDNSYKHAVKDLNLTPRHEATEAVSAGWFNSGVWHTECEDCHNPHTAGKTAHTSPVTAGTVLPSSSPIYGVGGVNVIFPVSNWGTPTPTTQYTYIKPTGVTDSSSVGADMEYKICLKCHSGFAWNSGAAPNSTSLGAPVTDQAQEFNPNNASYHPVAGANNVNSEGSNGFPGSSGTLWNAGSTQTMYCSDCHTRNGGGTPKGTHGSSNPFILSGPYADSLGVVSGTHQDADGANGLCFQCHKMSVYSTATNHAGAATDTGFRDSNNYNLHNQHRWAAANDPTNKRAYRCVNCHVRVAHGWQRKALVVLRGDGTPFGSSAGAYEAGGANSGLITSINFQPQNYTQASCGSSLAGNGITGCHL